MHEFFKYAYMFLSLLITCIKVLPINSNFFFRPGLSSGTTVSNKVDSCSQLSGAGSRGTPKNDLDSGSVSNERREHSGGLDNERNTSKGSNKYVLYCFYGRIFYYEIENHISTPQLVIYIYMFSYFSFQNFC